MVIIGPNDQIKRVKASTNTHHNSNINYSQENNHLNTNTHQREKVTWRWERSIRNEETLREGKGTQKTIKVRGENRGEFRF